MPGRVLGAADEVVDRDGLVADPGRDGVARRRRLRIRPFRLRV